MPCLRERREDIPELISVFMSCYCKKYKKAEISISQRMLTEIKNYCWPGNVRELEHVIERFVLLYDGSVNGDLLLIELLDHEVCCVGTGEADGAGSQRDINGALLSGKTIKERERERIERALENCDLNISRTASVLGMSRSTLYRKLRVFNLR
jgi:DNA-binding NtrC family response regulator